MLDRFEVHYFLELNSHSLDAIVQNRCEAEFLAVAYEIAEMLGIDVTLKAEALKEGGLKEVWEIVGENSNQITLLLLILTAVFTYMAIPDSDLTELQKENLKLQNQQLRYEIQKNNLNESDVIYPIKLANENPKVITRRSNFYKTLNNNQEVKKVGFSKFNKNNEKDKSEMIIKRPSFINFIQRSNKLPVEIDENAVIEIVAPVLREGGSKWKGIYLDEPIGFVISDIVYKTSVLNKEISFTSGNSIKCVLEIHKELNEVGEEIVKKYNVQTVLETIKSGSSQETPSGKRYKKVKAINGVQNDFFAQLDEE